MKLLICRARRHTSTSRHWQHDSVGNGWGCTVAMDGIRIVSGLDDKTAKLGRVDGCKAERAK